MASMIPPEGCDLSSLKGKAVRPRFRLQNAKLSAFDLDWQESRNEALEETTMKNLSYS